MQSEYIPLKSGMVNEGVEWKLQKAVSLQFVLFAWWF